MPTCHCPAAAECALTETVAEILEASLAQALEPDPNERPRDARALASGLADAEDRLRAGRQGVVRAARRPFRGVDWATVVIASLLALLGFESVRLLFAPPRGASVALRSRFDYETVLVPAAQTRRGARADEPYRSSDEEPEHSVTLTGALLVGRTEVTQRQWRAIMGQQPVAQGRYDGAHGPPQACHTYGSVVSLVGDDHPVVCVTWCEAVSFANRLSAQQGLALAYDVEGCVTDGVVTWDRDAAGWRLPTEAEWEHAARAGGVHRYIAGSPHSQAGPSCRQATFFGNVLDPSFTEVFPYRSASSPPPTAWRPDCEVDPLPPDGFAGLAPVGSFRPNQYGLYDMTGNVREWTFDVYGPYSSEPLVDPAGPRLGAFRTARGSAFDDDPTHWMLANRMALGHGQRAQTVGVRLVRNAGPRQGAPPFTSTTTVASDVRGTGLPALESLSKVNEGKPTVQVDASRRSAGATSSGAVAGGLLSVRIAVGSWPTMTQSSRTLPSSV